jgi:menaquinol-cytochrome c reductase cytochrome b/c subunit
MALDKTPDMEGLTPAERAALYKQRAAAAGIGRPPSSAGQETGQPSGAGQAAAPRAPRAEQEPARPAAQPPTSERPATTAAGTAVAERPAGAGVPAKVAAAAAARREQVAAVAAREGPVPSAKQQAERLVYVWPHLVMIEFVSAVLRMLSLVLVSILLQAPLEGHANADKTPNPSKAPWYFLNLQELLLHMHPALAGVLIPGGVVFAAIPLIPYIDRDTRDVGKWFGTPKAVPISWFTTVFTTIVLVAEIIFDEVVGVKPMMSYLAGLTGQNWLVDPEPLGIGALSLPNVIVPMIFMNAPIVVLLLLIKWIYKPDGIRDYMFALFTGFVVTYVVLTIFGTFLRGQGMHLYLPLDPLQRRLE